MTTPTVPCTQCCSPRCAGEGLTYNPTTRAYDVCTAPGGGIAVDANGCLVNTGGAGSTVVTGGTGTVVNAIPGGYQVLAPPSSAAGNIITSGPDGLAFLNCAAVNACVPDTVVNAGPGATVTGNGDPATPYLVSVTPSADPGNLITPGTDGRLFLDCADIAACGAGGTVVQDGPGATVTGAGTGANPYVVSVVPSTDADNRITVGADGNLSLSCEDIAGCVVVDGNPATPEVDVIGAGTPANPYLVTEVPLVTPRARVNSTVEFLAGKRVPGGEFVPMGATIYDRGGMFVGGPGSTTLVVPAGWAGVWSLGANVQFVGRQTFDEIDPGFRAAILRVNGTIVAYQQQYAIHTNRDSTILNLHTDFELVPGDAISIAVQWDDVDPAVAYTEVPVAANSPFSAAMWATFLHR